MEHSAHYALAAAIAIALPLHAQTNPQQGPYRMEISLERRESGAWHTIDPGLVLEQNDRVRFRFHTNFDGYLYVMNQSTSGTYSMLFPGEETGRENQIRAGKDYTVPATQTLFRITGPPGHEIVYWMVTPAELPAGEEKQPYMPLPPPPPKEKQLPSNMTPRCDDALFRARGACIDTSAGPKNVTSRELLPDNLAQVPSGGSGDLMFMRKQNTAVVSSPVPLKGPVIYEFHLAHK
ncbi:MAG: DUF4384 domain-containing protein [Acidobacteriia bacterium]|nr:DUF4384 domain-containing protein [Terriglobia bacterium]